MKEELSEQSMNDLKQILSESRLAVHELIEQHYTERPAADFGWTISEYAEFIGMSEETARLRLRNLEKKGLLEKKVINYPDRKLVFFEPGTWPE